MIARGIRRQRRWRCRPSSPPATGAIRRRWLHRALLARMQDEAAASRQTKASNMNDLSQAPLILITGGSRGVGAAPARLAAARGYDVAITFISREAQAQAVAADVEAAGRRALAVRADSSDPKQVAELFEAIDDTFGRIDVLVNNAAMLARQSRMEELDFERMQRIFAVNSIGPILCAQQAVRRM